MKYYLTLFLFFLSFVSFGQNQEKIDSLLIELDRKKNIETKAEIENKLSSLYRIENKLDRAEELANSALKKGVKRKNPIIISHAYLNLGNVCYSKWESSIAITYYQKVDSVLINNDIVNETLYDSKVKLGHLMKRMTDDAFDPTRKKSEFYYQKGLSIARELKDSSKEGRMFMFLGQLASRKGKQKEALNLYRKAEVFIDKNDRKNLSDLYSFLGRLYETIDVSKASGYMDKSFNLRNSSQNIIDKAIANWDYENHFFRIKNYERSIKYGKKSDRLLKKLENLDFGRLSGVNWTLYRSYEKLLDYENALNYYKLSDQYNDSAIAKSRNNKLEELEAKYQSKKKEQEIILLKSQNELAEQQKVNQRNLMLGGIGLTSIGGLFFFFLYHNRQKTTKKLQELDKAKSNFFANISHEFRTPLTLISGPIQKQLKKENLSNIERDSFKMIHRNSTRLLSLVDQLLDISKIEAGSLKLTINKGELMPFIGTLTDGFTYSAAQKQLNYSINIDPTSVETWFDKDALEKITVNLLSNAIKYTPTKGSIVCNAFVKDNILHFEVKNTGKSLSKDELSKVFERFYQLNENKQGVGIGLALVKELVVLHKGNITVESISDEWIIFKVVLPISKDVFKENEFINEVAHKSIKEEPVNFEILGETSERNVVTDVLKNSDNPILLMVDDNADIRTYVGNIFSDVYNILTAKNGQEGIDLAIEHVPDIIISDIMMPITNGIELCNTLKVDERTSHIPIILLTAKAGEENEMEGIQTGADDYITKPFNEDLLQLKVTKLLESRKKLQLRYSQEVILKPKDIAITSVDEQFLERLQKVLDEKLIESSFSIENFSSALGMSRMQLHRKLKALTGLSATEFIRSQRLKLAAQLLKKSEINVSQVGYSVGFNDHAYFSKCFKEMYHCTPTEYVNTIQ